MKKITSIFLCLMQILLLLNFSTIVFASESAMYDWENFAGKQAAIDAGVIDPGIKQDNDAKKENYPGIVTITNAANHPTAQNGLLEGTVKALMIQNRKSLTINNSSAANWAFKVNMNATMLASADDLKMYMCYEYSANHTIGVELSNGNSYYLADFNNDATNKNVYYHQWNWFTFAGKTFKQCGYGNDATKNITLTADDIKNITSILVWHRYDLSDTDINNGIYSRIYIDDIVTVNEDLQNAVTVTVDGVDSTIESGSEYTFHNSDTNGFIAYTDGTNLYDEGDSVVISEDKEFTTVSIGEVAMQKGASIRLGEVNGIRFYTTVNASLIDDLVSTYGAEISKGTLITPIDVANGNELTLNASYNKVDVKYTADEYYSTNTFVGSIANIQTKNSFNANSGNLAREFIGRGYIKVKIGDYEKEVYASYENDNVSNNTRSMAYVAYHYKNDENSDYSQKSQSIKSNVDYWASLKNTDALFNLSSKNYLNKIKIGINTGRSLDCMINKSGDTYTVADLEATEHKYDFIQPTDAQLISSFKSAGFNAVRMPVTWSEAIGDGPDYKISDILMDRVQEVVDMILEQDMYCILNSHNEFNWLYTRNTDLTSMYAKFTAMWEQISERFKDYDGRLMFEGYNEVLKLPDDWSAKQNSDYAVVNTLAQKFVNTVRASGSNNVNRFIIVNTYGAYLGEDDIINFTVPTDSANDKLILNVHYYFPEGAFGTKTVNMSTAYSDIDAKFNIVKNLWLDNGYAVMMNEFGIATNNTLENRVSCIDRITQKATELNIPMFWWDNGLGGLGLFDRSSSPYEQVYPTIISTIMNNVESRG